MGELFRFYAFSRLLLEFMRLTPHKCLVSSLERPKAKNVYRFICGMDDIYACWQWQTSADKNRTYNHHGQAVLRWRINEFYPYNTYTVARLLLEYKKGIEVARCRYTNMCGCVDCVNPDHWVLVTPLPAYIFMQTDLGWCVTKRESGAAIKEPLTLRVAVNGVVHTVSVVTGSAEGYTATCGSVLELSHAVVVAGNAPITCKKGC